MGVHDGHRARLKKRFDDEGLDAFQPHEALELLLFHAVARRDVNPLAHALVDRYGSLHGVLTAGEDALAGVPLVGGRTAALFTYLPQFFEVYRASRAEDRPVLRNFSAARAYCRRLVTDEGGERLWLMHLGADGGLILTESLSLPAPGGYPRPRQIIERALLSHAQALVIAQRRENAASLPADRDFAGILSELLALIGVTLMDGLILDGDSALSFRREGLLSKPLREASAAPGTERGWLPEDGGGHPSL